MPARPQSPGHPREAAATLTAARFNTQAQHFPVSWSPVAGVVNSRDNSGK